MKIYLPTAQDRPLQNVFVQPGNHPGNKYQVSDWLDNGKPIMFTVAFRFGCAEVPDNLGQYMLDNEMAKASPIIVIERKAA